jgi:pimeloyl-ACP methyl ester carboxylesterase
MKKWEIVLAIAGALILGLSAWAIHRTEPQHTDTIITAGDCHMPVTILEPRAKPRGTALLLHGLSADRRIMQPLGTFLTSDASLRVYVFDLPGHGDNTDPFSFARADACARITVESLIRTGEVDPKRTILVGHSMGGAIAIRAADRAPVAGTIALSPAPMPLPQRMPANLLVFSAQFDLPILKRAAQTLAQAAGGERTKTGDFLEARAFHLEVTPLSDHVSLLSDPRVFRQSGDWIDRTLGIASHGQTGDTESPAYANAAPFVGLLGILFLFPLCVAIAARIAGPGVADSAAAIPPIKLALAEGAVCALATVLLLVLFVPLGFLRLYTGDYLASLLLIAGVLLLALNWRAAKQSLGVTPRTLIGAAVIGFAVMLGIGAWLNWQVADLWMNAPRWLRFAALLPITWVYCFSEEVVLGPVGHGRRRTARFALSLALRAELWLACLLTYYTLASGQVLILILVASLALFCILQRLAADALRLRTGSPAAAALFGAILAAWFIAAIFPLT